MKWLKSRNYKRHYGHYISKITDFILHTPCICQTKIDLREVYKVHFESLKEGQVKFETFLRDFQQNSSEAFLEQGLYDVFSLNNYTIVLTTTVHEKDHLEISPVEKLNQVNQLIQKVYQQTCHQLQLTLSSD